MTVNSFFPHQSNTVEQDLLHDLFDEAVQIFGIDLVYIIRKTDGGRLDELYDEAPRAYYDTAVTIEMYLRSAEAFGGEGTFLSNLGIEIRDQTTFQVSTRRFTEVVGTPYGLARPREGDLIYYPKNKRAFEIRYVEKYDMLYPLGTLPSWSLKCELFEAQSTRFMTGNTEIDAIETKTTQDTFRHSVQNESNVAITIPGDNYWVTDAADPDVIDPLDDSEQIQSEADEFLNFDTVDIFTNDNF